MVVALQKQGGGSNIAPQPIMKVEVTKTKHGNSRLQSSVRCLLYIARMNTAYDKNALKDIDPNMSLSQMTCVQTGSTDSRDTKFGQLQIGWYLCSKPQKLSQTMKLRH